MNNQSNAASERLEKVMIRKFCRFKERVWSRSHRSVTYAASIVTLCSAAIPIFLYVLGVFGGNAEHVEYPEVVNRTQFSLKTSEVESVAGVSNPIGFEFVGVADRDEVYIQSALFIALQELGFSVVSSKAPMSFHLKLSDPMLTQTGDIYSGLIKAAAQVVDDQSGQVVWMSTERASGGSISPELAKRKLVENVVDQVIESEKFEQLARLVK